jgi:nitrogen-specific signal transduction histidine kinase/DNA-binding response OmpR family regulator
MRQAVLNLGGRWKDFVEAEHRQRQRLEEVNQLKTNVLSMVSHDLRTPLTSIQLYTQMLTEDLDNLCKEDQQHFLNTISEESLRLSRLVTDLLEVQRLEGEATAWNMQPVDLGATIRSVFRVFEPIAANKGIVLLLECQDHLPLVTANPDKIAQAVSNLLSNAMKYSPAGRSVRVRTEIRRDELQIVVADEGPGIPRDKWDAIFDRFAQLGTESLAGAQGVGLGLYIVSQIVERHGGRVWVDSQPGHGSEFTIALPVGRVCSQPAESSDTSERAGRVLVCDADPALAALLAQILRDQYFEVRLAHSGARLFEHLEEYQPDVVITDTALPDMRAADLIGHFRDMDSRSFKLILHSMRGDNRELRLCRADVFLERPVTRDELIRAVSVAMHKAVGQGLVVLLLNNRGLDSDQLSQYLVARGHMPILAQDLPAAQAYLRTYPIDLLLAKIGPEGLSSDIFYALQTDLSCPVHVCALTEHLSEKECGELSCDDVTFLPFGPGEEETLAEIIGAMHKQESVELPA